MATFTIELRDVIEHIFNPSANPLEWEQPYDEFTFNSIKYGQLPTVPDWTKLGLGTYPIFDEDYRPILNGKIVDAYFTREIGMETIDLWLLAIRRKMDQIMPYWNKIYESETIPYNALETMRIHSVSTNLTEGSEDVDTTNLTETDTIAESRAVQSSTPQTMLSGNGNYATGATDSMSKSDVDATSQVNSTSSNSTESNGDNLVTGFQGVSSDLVTRFRASLLNIDIAIIDNLEDCFMQLLNNGDSYTEYHRIGWY